MLEWLIAGLVIINVIFLSIIIFFLKIKDTEIDPMIMSMLGSGNPKSAMSMMHMMGGGKMDPMKMMLMSSMMESRKKKESKDLSQELRDEVMGELRPLIKDKLKREARDEIKKYFKLEG